MAQALRKMKEPAAPSMCTSPYRSAAPPRRRPSTFLKGAKPAEPGPIQGAVEGLGSRLPTAHCFAVLAPLRLEPPYRRPRVARARKNITGSPRR
jgi:hypothetical protein